MKQALGLISIGQAPRSDDIAEVLAAGFQVLQSGLLDGYTLEEANRTFRPEPGEAVLRARMRQGPAATVGEGKIHSRMQQAVLDMEARGCSVVLPFCTGAMPDFRHNRILLLPHRLLRCYLGAVGAVGAGLRTGMIMPDPRQRETVAREYPGMDLVFFEATPFDGGDRLQQQLEAVDGSGVDLFFLNCTSYGAADRELLRNRWNKPVILSRSLIGQAVLALA